MRVVWRGGGLSEARSGGRRGTHEQTPRRTRVWLQSRIRRQVWIRTKEPLCYPSLLLLHSSHNIRLYPPRPITSPRTHTIISAAGTEQEWHCQPLCPSGNDWRYAGARGQRLASGLKIDFGKWRCRVSPPPPKPLTSNPSHISASHCLVCFTTRVRLEGDKDTAKGAQRWNWVSGGDLISGTRLAGVKKAAADATCLTPCHFPHVEADSSCRHDNNRDKLHISGCWRFAGNDSSEWVSCSRPPFNC